MVPWSAFPWACFLGLFDVLECLGGLQNGNGFTGQVPTQLEITT